MKISLFKNAKDRSPVLLETAWPIPLQFQEVSNKLDARAISPCEFDGKGKEKENALQAHFCIFDIDHADEKDLGGIAEKCMSKNLTFTIYTTFSHAPPLDYRFRVLIPVDRPIPKSEFPLFWEKANDLLMNGLGDSACRDLTRIYFAPSHPIDPQHAPMMTTFNAEKGVVLAVDDLLKTIEADVGLIEKSDLLDFITSLKKAKTASKKELGKRMAKGLDGRVLAKQGERDSTCFKIACLLAEKWPRQPPDHLASFFKCSLDAMEAQGSKMGLGAFISKIERQQGSEWEKEKATEKKELEKRQKFIKTAFHGKREHPYTDQELDQWGGLDGMDGKWMIRKGDTFYFFVGGDYVGPFQRSEVRNAAKIELAASPLELTVFDESGTERQMGADDLIDNYGTVAKKLALDMRAQKAWYEEETRTLFEAPCPLRDLEPEFNEEIDQWLEIMGGNQLKEWVGFCANVDQPLVALYIEGVPQSGKSLLAQGLSRLWTKMGPTDLAQAMGHFNADLAQCPLALADEDLPAAMKKDKGTGALREFIQKRTRPLSRKFIANAQLLGCARLILAANNKDLLTTSENLNQNDIAAIAERFLYVRADFRARNFLTKIGGQTHINENWIEKDAIAKHALYLREVIPSHKGRTRFYVKTDVSELTQALTSASGFRGEICHWLFSYLKDPKLMDSKAVMGADVFKKEGRLYVGTKTLIDFWDVYLQSPPPKTVDFITKNLTGLGDPRCIEDLKGDLKHVWDIDLATLDQWAKNANLGSIKDLGCDEVPF